MAFLHNPERAHRKQLDQFRANFLHLISDGAYPPHRQQRLFQWCKKAGLDWDEARRYVADDAAQFLQHVVEQVIADGKLTADEVVGLQKLHKRLGLTESHTWPLTRLYDLIERKIETLIIERAAYLSSPALTNDALRCWGILSSMAPARYACA